ncbi:MAG: InlB B-repeat-containing protein, partial [Bacillota bacterium]|nr:InlB B-repeat-containing protein [Bacillota bacterium]
MRKTNKLLSILLSLVMLIGLLPTSVFAAGGAEKVDFAIKEHWGVYFEQTGSNKNYPITLTNENKLSVPIPTLYRTDYDGYVFDGWYIDSTDTKVTQDTVFDGYTVVVDRWTFQEKDNNTVISNIRVNNIALEAGMTTAEYNAAVQGATATVNGATASAITADSAKSYTIYHGLNKSGEILAENEEVEVGKDYSVVTRIKLADGYTFSPNITFVSDEGMCASERFLGGADIYTKEWNTLSNAIEVTINFMNTEYYFAQTPESRHLENYAQYRNWYKVSKVDGLESVTLQYEVDGQWALFIDNIPFEAVGSEAGGYVTVSPYVDTTKTFRLVANYTNGTVYSEPFEISWACLNPVIETIGIGITAPQNGYSPEYTVTTDTNRCTLKSENSATVKNGIKWTGDVVGELAVSGSKFNNDNDYTVSIKLVAQDGYTFANNVTATINANNANVNVVSETEIRVSYTFPKPEKTKWYVSFNNVGGYASGTMQSVQVEEGEYTLPEPTYTPNTGYVFEGWRVKGLLKQPGDKISVTEDLIIEAKWKDTNDYDAPHGFTKQPSDASEVAGIQIKYYVDNFTIDPSITYNDVLAQIYNAETGEWVTEYNGAHAGNGIDEAYGQQYIVFASSNAGAFTFRLMAKQDTTTVAISESFTVTWEAKQFTTQPQGDMVVVGDTVTVTADKNFYVEKYEIEYKDGVEWKLYQEVSGGWDAFSFDFTSNEAKSVTFRIKAYAEGDVYDDVNECWPIVLVDTSDEFTITWTSNEHVHIYGAVPNGKNETNHWKECTDPACPDKAHSKIESELHKDNTADYECDVCGYDMPVPTYTVSFEANGGTGTMADVTNVSGDYILPENGFTAPANKQFKAWSVGGNEKAVGATITVTANTTVTAVWEDIPALTGTVTITGDAKYGSTLTATVENSNNTGELHYQWVRDASNNITGANEQTYTILLENNINSTLKCIVTSSVQTGSIVSAPTAYVTKGDNLAVPTGLAGVAPTTLGGYDCYITGTTTAMEWSKYTDFHSTEGACSDGQTQVYHPGTYYVRYRQTSTYNAGTNYATVIVPDFGGAATYTVSFEANGGTGTMADVTNVSGDYVLPANGFTPPANKQFKAWNVGGNEKAVGDTINVTANTTVTAVWEDIPVVTYTVSFNANG